LAKYFTVFANSKSKDKIATRRCFVFFAEHEMMVIRKTIVAAFKLREQELGLPPSEPKPTPKARTLPPRDKTPTPATPSNSKTVDSTTVCFTL
jgi:hypothetical protein